MFDNKVWSITIHINNPQSYNIVNVKIQVNPYRIPKACDDIQDWGFEWFVFELKWK